MKDINIYNDRMRKSMLDKIFFIDKVEATVFVDFGCADGTMIKMLNGLFPEYKYIGYDNNPEMINLADANTNSVNCIFFSDWSKLLIELETYHKEDGKCLILSSVLHEIEDKPNFFDFLHFENFNYVAIRDMMYEEAGSTLLEPIYSKLPDSIRLHFGSDIWYGYNMIQAAFKSYYRENLETEMQENYFSFNQNHLITLKYKFGLVPFYEYHYLLPYWRQTIKKDFGVDLTGVKTHIQIIYEVQK